MPVSTLVATAGAANANAYVTLAVAEQYHLDRPAVGSTWEDADTDQKVAAILWATKLLDRYFEWNGSVVDTTQNLLWPRLELYKVNGSVIDSTTIPDEIQWATAEFARQLLVEDRVGDSDVETQGVKLIKVGPIRIDFKDSVFSKPIPDAVVSLIPSKWGYLYKDNGIRERELRRA